MEAFQQAIKRVLNTTFGFVNEGSDFLKLLRSQFAAEKRIEQKLAGDILAYVDDATGLYNTRYLNHILDHEIALSRSKRRSFAVLFVDIDRFKLVNETHGHLA